MINCRAGEQKSGFFWWSSEEMGFLNDSSPVFQPSDTVLLYNSFAGLVRQLLTESSSQLNQWREKLLTAFGSNGQVIIDVIPEMELIVGKLSHACTEEAIILLL